MPARCLAPNPSLANCKPPRSCPPTQAPPPRPLWGGPPLALLPAGTPPDCNYWGFQGSVVAKICLLSLTKSETYYSLLALPWGPFGQPLLWPQRHPHFACSSRLAHSPCPLPYFDVWAKMMIWNHYLFCFLLCLLGLRPPREGLLRQGKNSSRMWRGSSNLLNGAIIR